MGTELIVAPAKVEIAMAAVAITVPVMVPIMTAIVFIETLTIIPVKPLAAAASDAMVIVDPWKMLCF
jgi:hypothetical protein